ncbi:MAG TPA: AtpZ/AtpI family protein [Candidatus Saccharimonadales bacterium]|nr:AtpZ/AtpI family protein [Candidatus Saccharimonadales bacterium]
MNKAAASTTKPPSGPSPSVLGTIVVDLLDTAWRIATPILVFAGVGIIVDKKIGSAPWVTLLGVVIGLTGAGLLVKKQLEAVNRREQQ